MNKDKETFETWNNIATLYEEKFMHLNIYNASYDYICKAIDKPNAKLLDVGCGPGNITHYLLSKRPDFVIHGIDIAPNMITLARKNNPRATFEVMDTRAIRQHDEKQDAIIVGFCLPYLSVEESKKFIADASYLLHEGGLLYLSFVEGDPSLSDFKTGSGGRVYFHYHLLEEIKNQLKQAHFTPCETWHIEYKTSDTGFDVHTILIAKKKSA